jgi:hypothetical protein
MCKSSPTTAWRWRAPPESGSRRRSTISPVATRSGGSWRSRLLMHLQTTARDDSPRARRGSLTPTRGEARTRRG